MTYINDLTVWDSHSNETGNSATPYRYLQQIELFYTTSNLFFWHYATWILFNAFYIGYPYAKQRDTVFKLQFLMNMQKFDRIKLSID